MNSAMKERAIAFPSEGKRLAGILRYPGELKGPVPGVLLIHGALEQDRDGNLLRHPDGRRVFRKKLFLEIGKHLTSLGFAVFSWDRRGFGESQGPRGDLLSAAVDSRAALTALESQGDVVDPERLVVLGQSAGVYTACLLAREDQRPCCYILQGGLHREYSQLLEHNYLPVVDYANRGPEELAWLEQNDLWGLSRGLELKEFEEAGRREDEEFILRYGKRQWQMRPKGLCYREGYRPKELFRYIKKPVLILQGEMDLNVPVEDAHAIREELHRSRNNDVELQIIPGADHSFQKAPGNLDTRLREKFSQECFKRPYVEEYFRVLEDYLGRRVL